LAPIISIRKLRRARTRDLGCVKGADRRRSWSPGGQNSDKSAVGNIGCDEESWQGRDAATSQCRRFDRFRIVDLDGENAADRLDLVAAVQIEAIVDGRQPQLDQVVLGRAEGRAIGDRPAR